jgi:predicted TIM-barrel fold metal-dependent hydrolase
MLKNGPIVKACRFFKIDLASLPPSIDDLVQDMDKAGVEKAVLLGQDAHATPNTSFKQYTMSHQELLRIARQGKDRFVPFAGVDPNAGVQAKRELRRAIKELGFRGLKIHSSANSVYPNDRRKMYPLYETCQEFGLPILFHTGTTGLGDCEIKYSKPEYLDEVSQDFPDLRIIMAHFGWPWMNVAIAIALRNPNVFIDVSGWKPKHLPGGLLVYLNGPLQDRFVFGTDYPMLRQDEWMEDFVEHLKPKLKPGIAQKLLTNNAARLLKD